MISAFGVEHGETISKLVRVNSQGGAYRASQEVATSNKGLAKVKGSKKKMLLAAAGLGGAGAVGGGAYAAAKKK